MPIISQFNYLKEIYKLEAQSIEVSVSGLAKILNVTQPSVSQQLRALSNKNLVKWIPRGAIRLTPKGERWAIDLIRKHRIIESFLVKFLNYNPLQAHIEAEELEHLASDQFILGLHKLCGNPTYDPHGDPIPSKDGKFPTQNDLLPLHQLRAGECAEIAALSEQSHKTLQSVMDKKLSIGSTIQKGKNSNQFLVNGKSLSLNAEQVSAVYLKGNSNE